MIQYRPYEPWKVKPPAQFTFPTLSSDPPESCIDEAPTDDESRCYECPHLKTTRRNGRDITACELWECDREDEE